MVVNMIVAYCRGRGIGKNNTLPWHIPQDLKHFSKMTKGLNKKNIIIMGRHTWESLPNKPLRDRLNIVLSNTITLEEENVKSFCTLEEALDYYQIHQDIYGDVWIIGGYQVYKTALEKNVVDNLYVTYIDQDHECDTFFPKFPMDNFRLISKTSLDVKGVDCYWHQVSKNIE